MKLRVLHKALDTVGGAEILLVEQAHAFARAGADVELRTLLHSRDTWAARTGPLRVTALHEIGSGRRPRLTRTLNSRQIAWLLEELPTSDVSIAHGYPVSSALGAAASPGLRVWYCHEAPRWLHPQASNPYLARHAERAPERHAPAYYRRSFASPLGALPLVGRRRASRVQADVRGVSGLGAVWANSEYTRDSVRRIYPGVDVEVVYPFVHFPPEPPRRSGKPASELGVLCVTRLEWVKNLDTLLEGFALFRRGAPAARLEIVGTGPAREALGALARELGIDGRVRFHGFLPDAELDALSARCDVFACLPLDEPFGMIFPEAVARGLLVLGPDHGGPLEILEGGRLGEIAAPLEPEAVAEGLARLARLSDADANDRRRAADAACRARFSPDVVAARMLELLRRKGAELGRPRRPSAVR
ncbi:MAG TPA: glycosyltransferase family 4 protein [Polyangiaceae bacterium]